MQISSESDDMADKILSSTSVDGSTSVELKEEENSDNRKDK